MKLGSLKGGRDGRLVVVSRDLAWCADATHLAPTLQTALGIPGNAPLDPGDFTRRANAGEPIRELFG